MDHVAAHDSLSAYHLEAVLPEALSWHAETNNSFEEYMEIVIAKGSIFIEIGPVIFMGLAAALPPLHRRSINAPCGAVSA